MVSIRTINNADIGKRKSLCWICDKIIIKGEPRVWKYDRYNEKITKRFFCIRCGERQLEYDVAELKQAIPTIKKIKKRLEKLKSINQSAIILSQLENEKADKEN